nr:hypothetical protein [Roseomonas sp. SXEYE001]MCV4210125.1 hypothetical protein [Roseomonas sp. SXEYE001]
MSVRFSMATVWPSLSLTIGASCLRLQGFAEAIGVVGLVGKYATRRRDAVEQVGSDADVGDVAGCQDEGERSAFSIGHSVDLAGPPAT